MGEQRRVTTELERIEEKKKSGFPRYSEGKHEDDATKAVDGKRMEESNPSLAYRPMLVVA